MAENKKSFIMYADQREQFDQLSDEQAGKLVKHLFAYVNDEDPQTDDMVTKLSFTPIKSQLKRDLTKWDKTRGGRSKAGKASAEARRIKKEQTEQKETKSTNVKSVGKNSTNPTVNVNANVNVNDNVTVNENDIKIKGVIFPFDSEKFKKQWDLWKDYKKKEFKFDYKSIQSEQAALIKLAKLANQNEDNAILIINQSFENGWKGFFNINNQDGQQSGKQATNEELAQAVRDLGLDNRK